MGQNTSLEGYWVCRSNQTSGDPGEQYTLQILFHCFADGTFYATTTPQPRKTHVYSGNFGHWWKDGDKFRTKVIYLVNLEIGGQETTRISIAEGTIELAATGRKLRGSGTENRYRMPVNPEDDIDLDNPVDPGRTVDFFGWRYDM